MSEVLSRHGYELNESVDSLRWWSGTVVETTMETPSARTLTIAVPGWAGHAAGQYVDIRRTMSDGFQAARSYSIASPPEEGERLRIAVEHFPGGDVSPYLTGEVQPGDRLALRGPLGGDFTWQVAQGEPLLLIAGGSGIVPLMAMLRHRTFHRSHIPATLLYSVRTDDDIFYRTELTRLAADDPALRVALTLTRSQPPAWTGYHRRIDAMMLRAVAWSAQDQPLVDIAGSTPFVEAVVSSLLDLNYDLARIHTEWFLSN